MEKLPPCSPKLACNSAASFCCCCLPYCAVRGVEAGSVNSLRPQSRRVCSLIQGL